MTVELLLKSLVLVVSLGLALYYDIREQKIKNFITIPAAIAGLLINTLVHGFAGLLFSLWGWLIPVLVLMVFYSINTMGAGDIKLFAATGAIMGLPFAAYSFIFSVYIGGVIAVFLLIKRNEFGLRMRRIVRYVRYLAGTGRVALYSSREDKTSKFIFSTAIVPATLLQLYVAVRGIIQ